MFGEKCVCRPEKCYSSTDLYLHIEKLVKRSLLQDQRRVGSNYSWLRARELNDVSTENHMKLLRPAITKMTSESCAAVAVKLDDLTDEAIYPLPDLLTLIKNLLLEQDSMTAIEKNIKGVKETKDGKRSNKVQPDLAGRRATVSFILESVHL